MHRRHWREVRPLVLRRSARPILLLGVLASLALLPAALASAAVLTSDKCGECHKTIYKTWRGSAHSRSLEDEVFLDAYRDAEAREAKEVSRSCLRCHAPLAELNKDWALEQKSSWEGVNCDVCHSLVEVDFSGPTPTGKLDIGQVKRGPIADAASIGHEVQYSELHTRSDGCAWCHEFQTADGVPLMSTYTEWKKSSSATKGVTCQACHMSRTKGDVVDPKIARVERSEINLHEAPGGHSIEQLNRALHVSLEPSRREDSLVVRVRLTNKGAGHAVPTGMPGRRVILELTVRPAGKPALVEKRVYGRTLLDAEGNVITRDREHFRAGVRAGADTRIAADEVRAEWFRFAIPRDADVNVGVRLTYEHLPMGEGERGTRLTFYQEGRTLAAAG
jgi:hypothetical protein